MMSERLGRVSCEDGGDSWRRGRCRLGDVADSCAGVDADPSEEGPPFCPIHIAAHANSAMMHRNVDDVIVFMIEIMIG